MARRLVVLGTLLLIAATAWDTAVSQALELGIGPVGPVGVDAGTVASVTGDIQAFQPGEEVTVQIFLANTMGPISVEPQVFQLKGPSAEFHYKLTVPADVPGQSATIEERITNASNGSLIRVTERSLRVWPRVEVELDFLDDPVIARLHENATARVRIRNLENATAITIDEDRVFTAVDCVGCGSPPRHSAPSIQAIRRTLAAHETLDLTLNVTSYQAPVGDSQLSISVWEWDHSRPTIKSMTLHLKVIDPTLRVVGPPGGALLWIVAGLVGVVAAAIALLARFLRRDPALAAPLLALYARITRPRLLDHATRERVHARIVASPGVSFTALRRALDLPSGVATHHLRALERNGFVTSRREGGLRCYYAAGAMPAQLPPTAAQRHVLDALAAPAAAADLAARLGVSRQAVSAHLLALERRGLVRRDEEGRWTRAT